MAIICGKCKQEMKEVELTEYEFEDGIVLENVKAMRCPKGHVTFTEEQALLMEQQTKYIAFKRELKQVKNSLADFEKRHKMSSDEFYEKFNAGKLGDDREYIKWYAYKDTFNKLMERLKEIEKIVHA